LGQDRDNFEGEQGRASPRARRLLQLPIAFPVGRATNIFSVGGQRKPLERLDSEKGIQENPRKSKAEILPDFARLGPGVARLG
jgi:hypothetical protein